MTDSEQGPPGLHPNAERTAALTGRLTALSDGVFAIAMTLLVLNISVPPDLGAAAFHEALREQLPNLGAYALSFVVIAQFWRDHRYVLDRVDASVDRGGHLTLLGLGLVALLPFRPRSSPSTAAATLWRPPPTPGPSPRSTASISRCW